MRRYPPLALEEIDRRLSVDLLAGRCYWKDPTKHHRNLVGKEAGSFRAAGPNKKGGYWVIKMNGVAYKRAQIILMVCTGRWPHDIVDHKNGNKMDDRATNLRHASALQNAWNHRTRAKNAVTPMGVRALPNGRFQARIAYKNQQIAIGSFDTQTEAALAYTQKRKELYGEYSGM